MAHSGLLKWDTLHLPTKRVYLEWAALSLTNWQTWRKCGPLPRKAAHSKFVECQFYSQSLAFISHFLTFYHYHSLENRWLTLLLDDYLILYCPSMAAAQRLFNTHKREGGGTSRPLLPSGESFIACLLPLPSLNGTRSGSICCLENFFLNSYQFFPSSGKACCLPSVAEERAAHKNAARSQVFFTLEESRTIKVWSCIWWRPSTLAAPFLCHAVLMACQRAAFLPSLPLLNLTGK